MRTNNNTRGDTRARQLKLFPQSTRLRLWTCRCPRPIKIRAAHDHLQIMCLSCGHLFERQCSSCGQPVPVSSVNGGGGR